MKSNRFTRRDFLKVLGASGLFYPASRLFSPLGTGRGARDSNKPNFLILLFDALTARHVSLYGYSRPTTPNIDRFAKNAVVYRRHYSSSNHTKPSTSSLLTGAYPWSHRAFIYYTAMLEKYGKANLFSQTPAEYYNLTFTHNTFVTGILEEFRVDIDLMKPMEELAVYNPNAFQNLFAHDPRMGFYASKRWRDDYIGPANSLFLHPIFKVINGASSLAAQRAHGEAYPLGLSDNMEGYLYKLEDAIDWLAESAAAFPKPYLAYVHLLPPHEAYKPRADFFGMFAEDGYHPPQKPESFFSEGLSPEFLSEQRRLYDEYIAFVDEEFGRLYNQLERSGALDNTYLILTSDHGQGFERGIHGHGQPVLYETNIHIPLIIRAPGQTQGAEVSAPTSIVDLTPTILHLAGQSGFDAGEGRLLPLFGGAEDQSRVVFSMETKSSYKLQPISKGTLSALRWPHKLIVYKGYEGLSEADELYDLENDPEEMNNLIKQKPSIAASLRDELEKSQSAAEKISLG